MTRPGAKRRARARGRLSCRRFPCRESIGPGALLGARKAAWEKHYPWVKREGLEYFQTRTQQAPNDAKEGLRFVLEHAKSSDDGERCIAALTRKCEILWDLLDAIVAAHARPRLTKRAQVRDEEDGEKLVVLPERAVKLNASGIEILSLCDGEQSAEAIATQLLARHADALEIASDVHFFINEMMRHGVLEDARKTT